MAEFLGIPHVSYQRLDAGTVFPRPKALAKIIKRLGVSEASLVQLPPVAHRSPGSRPLLKAAEPAQDAETPQSRLLGLIVLELVDFHETKLSGLLDYIRAYGEGLREEKDLLSKDR